MNPAKADISNPFLFEKTYTIYVQIKLQDFFKTVQLVDVVIYDPCLGATCATSP